jgi:hypothetical protein
LYIYDIKIQIDINQNDVEKYAEKSQFSKIYFLYGTGPDPAHLCELDLHQPSRVGWADVPAQNEQKG